MESVAAHELGLACDCSAPGCTRDASDSPTRGPYANKCDEHREQTRQKIVAGRQKGALGLHGPPGVDHRPPQQLRPVATGRSSNSSATELERSADVDLEDACRRMARLAKHLKAAHRNHSASKAIRQQAFDEFRQGLEEIQQAARTLLGT